MSNDTAPYIMPQEITTQQINVENLDMSSINLFNHRITICSQCDQCVEKDRIPTCANLIIPLTVVVQHNNCPIGRW